MIKLRICFKNRLIICVKSAEELRQFISYKVTQCPYGTKCDEIIISIYTSTKVIHIYLNGAGSFIVNIQKMYVLYSVVLVPISFHWLMVIRLRPSVPFIQDSVILMTNYEQR
jgi:hypothetical protein